MGCYGSWSAKPELGIGNAYSAQQNLLTFKRIPQKYIIYIYVGTDGKIASSIVLGPKVFSFNAWFIHLWMTLRPYMDELWEPMTNSVRDAVEDRQKTTKKTMVKVSIKKDGTKQV